jgi:hypothetical protein
VPHPLSSSVSCAPPSGLDRCRVGSYSRSVSDGRSRFGGFLDRDLLISWLLSHQWIVCVLSADLRQCRWGRLSPPRSSFFINGSHIYYADCIHIFWCTSNYSKGIIKIIFPFVSNNVYIALFSNYWDPLIFCSHEVKQTLVVKHPCISIYKFPNDQGAHQCRTSSLIINT